MPKKSASARATAQRAKQKTQKNFELVRPIEDEPSSPEEDIQQPTSTPTTAPITKPLAPSGTSSPVAVESPVVATSSAPASAATRLAARRQSQQRQQQRATSSLITAEHYSYVRKDLIYIAILAVVMLAAIIVLYFMIGINA
jgi:hypothetical protein